MINPKHMRAHIIFPALGAIGKYSADAEETLILTMATETLGGYDLVQEGGPALGILQMEPATHDDLWRNFISPRPGMARLLQTIYSPGSPRPMATKMTHDLYYAVTMARIFYERVAAPLPDRNDVAAMAEYYKKYWNTSAGAATVENVIANYERYIRS